MINECLKIAAVASLCAALTMAQGCGRAKRKFKVPDIKIITTEDVQGVAAPDDDHIWIAGNYGMIYHSADGGQHWAEQNSGVKTLLCSVSFTDSKTGWVCGNRGTILHTSDGGATWSRQESGVKTHILAVSFLDRQHGWAVGSFATILHTTDGGMSWARAIEKRDIIYNNLHFADRQTGWVIGEHGTILHTSDGGKNWEKQKPESFKRASFDDEYDDPIPALFGIFFTDRYNGWICGHYSTIIHTTNGGKTWKEIPTAGEDPLYSIFIKGDRGWAVGNRGAYYLSRNSGMSWDLLEEAVKSRVWFGQVLFSSPQKGWIVGSRGTVVHSTDGGEKWRFSSGLSYEFEGFTMPEELEKRVFE